jgi:kynurenine formamidase
LPWAGPLGAESTKQIDLNRLTGPAVVVDVRHLTGSGAPGTSPPIEPAHLAEHEAAHGRFRPGDVALLRTGVG